MTMNKQEQWREEFELQFKKRFSFELKKHSQYSDKLSYVSSHTGGGWNCYLAACKKRDEEQRLKNEKALEAFNNLLWSQLNNEEYKFAVEIIKSALESV